MKFKKTALTAIVAATIGLGAAGQATASIYAGSALTFDTFTVTIEPFAGAVINDFNFNSTNTAQLNNGAVDATGGNCGGTIAVNNCGTAPNVLAPGAANAAGGTVTRADGDYTTQFGPGTDQYANSNSRIEAAQLVDFIPTAGQLISEAEIQGGTSAAANAELSSQTNFTFNFTVTDAGTMTIAFDATKYLLAAINDPLADTAGARASVETRFTLQQNTGGSDFWQWSPQGDGTGCVTNLAGGCNVTSSAFDLNDSAQTGSLPVSSDDQSFAGSGFFSANTGPTLLSAGDYSLTLFTKVSAVVSRTVPEPSTLLLMGAGLAGLGFVRRRKKS